MPFSVYVFVGAARLFAAAGVKKRRFVVVVEVFYLRDFRRFLFDVIAVKEVRGRRRCVGAVGVVHG